jgi:hypothetical protein
MKLKSKSLLVFCVTLVGPKLCSAFLFASNHWHVQLCQSQFKCPKASKDPTETSTSSMEENKAMSFLRKVGKVGGVANVDFTNAMGVDEGPAGKMSGPGVKPVRKAKSAYQAVTVNGVVDDLSEPFPVTSSGTQWAGFTDQVMGGRSSGREILGVDSC